MAVEDYYLKTIIIEDSQEFSATKFQYQLKEIFHVCI